MSNIDHFDALAMIAVWAASVMILFCAGALLNRFPRSSHDIWINIQKILLLILIAGAICNLAFPVFGLLWLFYGGTLVTIAVGAWLGAAFYRKRFHGYVLELQDPFDIF